MKQSVKNLLVFASFAIVSFAIGWLVIENMKDGGTAEKPRYNRLIDEKSPYLLQHADNPVDWYPWGEEAFEAAKRENKPVFLSIGYSTCHWCHVMARESFQDSAVAALMNETFINIKVDREERPDIDNLYMTVCQMLTGRGGWPLTIIMTPDKKPFFADTYIARETGGGRLGMLDAVPKFRELWKIDRSSIDKSAETITQELRSSFDLSAGGEVGPDILDSAYAELRERYDAVSGGFGRAPKFPNAHNYLFLLRYWKRTGDSTALAMTEHSLQQMAASGLYDQVGHGFHRYAVDREWQIPHFEKMLYDQALLALAYTEAYEATGKDEYRRVASEVLGYVARDLTAPEGGFYSAESAESEKMEGTFYVWTKREIIAALEQDQARALIRYYSISDEGNFHEGAGKEQPANVLHRAESEDAIAADLGITIEELRSRLTAARARLFELRSQRERPSLDDKILTDWNGLMIAAFARAGRVFGEAAYTDQAARAADFVLTHLRTPEGRLLHRYREGEAGIPANAADYSHLVWGLTELYGSSFNLDYLESALALNDTLIAHYWDKEQGGLYFIADDQAEHIARQKQIHDKVTPSANAVSKLNFVRLARLTGRTELERYANQIGRVFAESIKRAPSSSAMFLAGLDFVLGPSYEIVVVADAAEQAQSMLRALGEKYIPNKVVLLRVEDGRNDKRLNELAEFTQYQSSLDGMATVYVCVNFACQAPVTDAEEMLTLLQ